jgi:hypothetical protein
MRTLAALLLLLLLAGCGTPKGKVSGQVRYAGAPLPGGQVTFRPIDTKYNAVAATLDEQGHFEVILPVGEVQVSVDNRELQPRSAAAGGIPADLPPQVKKSLGNVAPQDAPPPTDNPLAVKPRGRYVLLPPKYHTIENSGLQFTVAPGEQEHIIELVPGR